MSKLQFWEAAIALTGVFYDAGSLIHGLQSPPLGLLLVGAAAMKIVVSFWTRHGS
jgi:hypothetical protein